MKTFLCWLIGFASEIIIVLEILAIVLINMHNVSIADFSSNESASSTFFIAACIASLIFAIFVIVFTYRNIEEVISRQFKWRNSRASSFDYRLKYSLGRGLMAILISGIFFYGLGVLLNIQ